MHKVNVSIPNKVAYRSQSTPFKLFRSISARLHSQRKTSIFIRISGKNSAANSDIRRRLGV